MLVYFFLLYTGPWVWAAHPAFPASSKKEGTVETRAQRAARTRLCACVIPGRRKANPESIPPGVPAAPWILRCATRTIVRRYRGVPE